jgi:molybdopterin-synthase adenylyltransferase
MAMQVRYFVRHRDLFDGAGAEVTVVGVGAIGHQVARLVAGIGIPKINLIDPDQISEVNVGPQGYSPKDIGKDKVSVCGDELRNTYGTEVNTFPRVVKQIDEMRGYVFLCVDRIDTRERVFRWLKSRNPRPVLIDGRMQSEVFRVICAHDDDGYGYYQSTLFDQSEQVEGRCTTRSTSYSAAAPASFMVANLTKHLRRHPVEKDLLCDMFSTTFTVLA